MPNCSACNDTRVIEAPACLIQWGKRPNSQEAVTVRSIGPATAVMPCIVCLPAGGHPIFPQTRVVRR